VVLHTLEQILPACTQCRCRDYQIVALPLLSAYRSSEQARMAKTGREVEKWQKRLFANPMLIYQCDVMLVPVPDAHCWAPRSTLGLNR
jgi:hypothetical protein